MRKASGWVIGVKTRKWWFCPARANDPRIGITRIAAVPDGLENRARPSEMSNIELVSWTPVIGSHHGYVFLFVVFIVFRLRSGDHGLFLALGLLDGWHLLNADLRTRDRTFRTGQMFL